jgi:hypothetical protein
MNISSYSRLRTVYRVTGRLSYGAPMHVVALGASGGLVCFKVTSHSLRIFRPIVGVAGSGGAPVCFIHDCHGAVTAPTPLTTMTPRYARPLAVFQLSKKAGRGSDFHRLGGHDIRRPLSIFPHIRVCRRLACGAYLSYVRRPPMKSIVKHLC